MVPPSEASKDRILEVLLDVLLSCCLASLLSSFLSFLLNTTLPLKGLEGHDCTPEVSEFLGFLEGSCDRGGGVGGGGSL